MVNVKVLGCGSAFTPQSVSTSFLIEYDDYDVLVDCGFRVFEKLITIGYDFRRLKYVAITHTHEDHISQLASLFHYIIWMTPYDTPRIIADGVAESVSVDVVKYLQKMEVPRNKIFMAWDGICSSFRTKHTNISSCGFVFEDDVNSFVITGDTKCIMEVVDIYREKTSIGKNVIIYHDCQIIGINPPDSLMMPHATSMEIPIYYPKEVVESILGVHYGNEETIKYGKTNGIKMADVVK